jgi:hypothetical protein
MKSVQTSVASKKWFKFLALLALPCVFLGTPARADDWTQSPSEVQSTINNWLQGHWYSAAGGTYWLQTDVGPTGKYYSVSVTISSEEDGSVVVDSTWTLKDIGGGDPDAQ